MAVKYTQQWLNKTGKEWQQRLRLTNWVIHFKLTDDLNGQYYGLNDQEPSKKVSKIAVMNPAFVNESVFLEYDPEITLVHELLHLHLSPLRTHDNFGMELETAIEMISSALVAARRGKKSVRIIPRTFNFEEAIKHLSDESD